MKKLKLVCLPYAGGSALMYRAWNGIFPDFVEIVQLELPGRGLRFKDKNAENMEALTEDMTRQLQKKVKDDEEYILLGFCYGAIVAYSIYEKLARENQFNLPKGMILISSLSPGMHSKAEKLFEMSNWTIVKTLLGIFSFSPWKASAEEMDILKTMLELVNPEVAEELRKMSLIQLILAFLFPFYKKSGNCQTVLRIMREDGRIMYGYNGENDCSPVTVPVLAIHGKTDHVVSMENMMQWKRVCEDEFRLEEVDGGHLMLFDKDEHFIQLLNQTICKMA